VKEARIQDLSRMRELGAAREARRAIGRLGKNIQVSRLPMSTFDFVKR
jgi:hypothetical protein